jgi:hypothetical protein
LDQVAAGVGADRDHDRAVLRRWLGEHDAPPLQSLVLLFDVCDLERIRRDALGEQTFLIGLADWVGIRLERQY